MFPRPSTPAPPSPAEALENVTALHAEAVGRNMLAMVDQLRRRGGLLRNFDALIALSLARLGRATLDELEDDYNELTGRSIGADRIRVVVDGLVELGAATVRTERGGDVWTAVAR